MQKQDPQPPFYEKQHGDSQKEFKVNLNTKAGLPTNNYTQKPVSKQKLQRLTAGNT